MPDRIFYPLAALVAVGLIALGGVYPQGQGARSPKPFGHATWAETHPKKAPKPAAPGTASDQVKLKGPV
ncbi:MAG: hypothetical protein M3N05_05225 [Pseudomonadota bacterium]|nr:hypothetical protein [Pseudomonadota bacterium]